MKLTTAAERGRIPWMLRIATLALLSVTSLAACRTLQPEGTPDDAQADVAPAGTLESTTEGQSGAATTDAAERREPAATDSMDEGSEIDSAVPAGPPRAPEGELDGIPVGFTEDDLPYRGSPDAPIVVEEFSDYHCPFCARFATQTQPTLLERYVATGKVRFVFHEYPIISLHPTADRASVAARCVAEQGAEAYWRMHDALFERQTASTGAADPDAWLAELAVEMGADPNDYAACMTAGRADAIVANSVASTVARGYNGTPSFSITVPETGKAYDFIGAQPVEDFSAWFDALLAGDEPPVPPTPEPPQLPYWASPEGLAPDPDRPGLTMAGNPFRGDADAPMTVIEFTDYQCPPCRAYALDAQPGVDQALVDTGKVRWVIKHLPLPEHPQSRVAAAAAVCAAEQNRYWEMSDQLFERVDEWSIDEPDSVLAELADAAGLDVPAFSTCLSGRRALEPVLTDVQDASGVAGSTPTFLVMVGGVGNMLTGNQSSEAMMKAIEAFAEA